MTSMLPRKPIPQHRMGSPVFPNEIFICLAEFLPTADLNRLLQCSRWLEFLLTRMLYDRLTVPREDGRQPYIEEILHWASEKGQERPVHRLLDRGAPLVSEFYHSVETPLYLAASNGHIKVVEIFLERSPTACMDYLLDEKKSPFNAAVYYGHADIVSLLLPYLNKNQILSTLGSAGGYGRILEILLPLIDDTELDEGTKRKSLFYALEGAAVFGSTDSVALLLPYFEGAQLAEPLHTAVRNGSAGVVHMLLSHIPADTRSGLATGMVRLAVSWKRTAVVYWLIQAGCDTNTIVSPSLMTILHWTCKFACSMALNGGLLFDEAVAVLLRGGANFEAVDDAGLTALHIAARNGPDFTRRYLQRWLLTGKLGSTTLVEKMYQSLLELLVGAGVDINARDNLGRTALHEAVQCRDKVAVESLLGLGADSTIMDNKSKTALQLVEGVYGTDAVADVLRNHDQLISSLRGE